MIINREVLDSVGKGFKQTFDKAYEEADKKPIYKDIATIVDVKDHTVDYKWLGDIPSMQEWVDERVLKNLQAFEYSIKKKDWEVTIEVERDDIMFDKLNMVKPRLIGMAGSVVYHYNELIFNLLEANGACYDGENFFSAAHTIGATTYSNIGVKKLTSDNFITERTRMTSQRSDTGRNLFIKPNLLVVPPELEMEAKKILEADLLDGGVSNLTKGLADYVVSPYLTNPNGWYLLDTTKAVKPFILQITKKPQFVPMTGIDDESAFMKKKYRYGVDTMDNVGYGLWQLASYNDGSEA